MLDDVWGKEKTWNWQKQLEKYSQNTSWFWEQTAEAFTPSGLSEMTSHTPVTTALPASAVWGIYRPLWALIHPSTHTHTQTHNWRWSQTSECSMSSNSHTERQQGYRIHPQMTPQWFELETVWERHKEPLRQNSCNTDWDVCLTVFNVYISIFMYLLWNGLKAHFFQLDEQSFQWTCQCNQ